MNIEEYNLPCNDKNNLRNKSAWRDIFDTYKLFILYITVSSI
jgi:hypothetical protein